MNSSQEVEGDHCNRCQEICGYSLCSCFCPASKMDILTTQPVLESIGHRKPHTRRSIFTPQENEDEDELDIPIGPRYLAPLGAQLKTDVTMLSVLSSQEPIIQMEPVDTFPILSMLQSPDIGSSGVAIHRS